MVSVNLNLFGLFPISERGEGVSAVGGGWSR